MHRPTDNDQHIETQQARQRLALNDAKCMVDGLHVHIQLLETWAIAQHCLWQSPNRALPGDYRSPEVVAPQQLCDRISSSRVVASGFGGSTDG